MYSLTTYALAQALPDGPETTDAAGDASTGYRVLVGDQFVGEIGAPGDRDWIAFDLVEGQSVYVGLYETDAFFDPLLRVLNPVGEIVGESDNFLYDDGWLYFTADQTGTFFIEASAVSEDQTGDYWIETGVYDVPETYDPLASIDAQIYIQNGVTNGQINVHFAAAGVSVSDGGGFMTTVGFNAYELGQFEKAFDLLEDVIDVDFVIVDDPEAADLRLHLIDDANRGYLGGMFFPVPDFALAGFGFFNLAHVWDRSPGGTLEQGARSFRTIIHEISHGLGLGHPFESGAPYGGSDGALPGLDYLPVNIGPHQLNQGVFSTLTYNGGLVSGSIGAHTVSNRDYGFEGTYGPLDLAVLQRAYGANTTTRPGNDTYTLPILNQIGTFWRAIWDTAGVDAIVNPGAGDATIDLRAATLRGEIGGGGFLSAVDGIAGGFTIANGVVIENASGGTGADHIIGNTAANLLSGNDGHDELDGGHGDDTLDGGSGDDILHGGPGNNLLIGGAGTLDRAVFAQSLDQFTIAMSGDDLLLTTGADTTTVRDDVELIEMDGVVRSYDELAASFVLIPGELQTGVFGNHFGGETDANGRISATFQGLAAPMQLSLTGYDIDSPGEVEVLVNGQSIGFLDRGVDNGPSTHILTIPVSVQQPGTNTVTFVQQTPTYKWGMTDIRLEVLADFSLTRGVQDTGIYGQSFLGASDADGTVFATFIGMGTDLNLALEGYDIDSATEVEVLVNGVSLGFLDKGSNDGLSQHDLVIPASAQVAGQNVLAFRQAINPAWKWGVTNLTVTTVADMELSEDVIETGHFGNGFNGATNASGQVIATFDWAPPNDVVLDFRGYDIDTNAEVEIRVNGHSLGHLPAGENNTETGYQMVLPGAWLDEVENVITFEQVDNPDDNWGVTDLLLRAADGVLLRGVTSTTDLGNAYNGTSAADGVAFLTFEGTSRDMALSFRGFDIDGPAEVEIFVNGTSIGFVSAGVNNGMSDHSVVIPAGVQTSGVNLIAFEQAVNPNWRWGIDDVTLQTLSDALLTVGVTETGSFGNGFNGAADPDGEVVFSFLGPALPGDLVLGLTGFDIDRPNEVLAHLNGVELARLTGGVNNGSSEHVLAIEADLVLAGAENILTFTQVANPNYVWGVTDILIEPADSALAPTIAEAGEFGNRFNGTTDTDGSVNMTFLGGATDLNLEFAAFDIDGNSEVEVLVNGTSQGFLPAGVNNGLSTHSLTIAEDEQIDGLNVLSFVQQINPAYAWGVTDILLGSKPRCRRPEDGMRVWEKPGDPS